MKTLATLAFLLTLLFTACEKKEAPKPDTETTPAAQQGSKAIDPTPVNTYCMVMTEHEIDPKVTLVYEGKTYGFCCKECPPKFLKEPAKYIAAFEAKMKESKAN